MHKDYLVLNNLKWLICYIIQPKQIVKILYIYIYIYIRFVRFVLVGLYGISTILAYLIPNNLYFCILDL